MNWWFSDQGLAEDGQGGRQVGKGRDYQGTRQTSQSQLLTGFVA